MATKVGASGGRSFIPMLEQDILHDMPAFRSHNEIFQFRTTHAPQFIDMTDDVAMAVSRSEVLNGIVTIFSQHTTAAIKINESEPELLKDMARFLEEVAPVDRDYHHNDFTVRTVNMTDDECPNAHSHCQHLLLSASENVPILDGRLALGRWQRIFLVELDRAKSRRVTVQILGV
ncbi:MAG: secondary thiamine-phosphate synthase enzyme YjbQ [Chloroflexota bacterium]